MIELKDVNKEFKKQMVIEQVSVTFEDNKIYGIVGYNGSGKTVILKMISGLLLPSSGSVIVNGKIIGKDRDFPENLGMIIETPGFIPYLSGFQNLKNIAAIKGGCSREKIKETIKKVGLDPKLKKPVSRYSLGMRQRLGIAQAIMEDPDILLLDEPMNGLDQRGVEEIRRLLLSLKREGRTILLCSHNALDIDLLCDQVYRVENKQLKLERV